MSRKVIFVSMAVLIGLVIAWSLFLKSSTRSLLEEKQNQIVSPETAATHIVARPEDAGAVLLRIQQAYPEIFFSEVENYDFEWREIEENESTSSPVVSRLSGLAIPVTDMSFQDLPFGERSVLFRLENDLVPHFFLKEMNFVLSPENNIDGPDQSSTRGYKDPRTGVVCLRIIKDLRSEFILYHIACAVR